MEIQQDKTMIGEVEVADDIEHSAVEPMVPSAMERLLRLNPSTSPMTR